MSINASSFVKYQPECSAVNFGDFSEEQSLRYFDEDYVQDTVEDEAIPGLVVGGICLLIAGALVLWSFCLCCCVQHFWRKQPAIHRIVEGNIFKRILSFFLIACIVVATGVIMGFCAWGIYETTQKVDDAIDSSFDFVAETRDRVDTILVYTIEAIDNGENIVAKIETVNEDLGKDPNLQNPVVRAALELDRRRNELTIATEEARKALSAAEEELITIEDIDALLGRALEYQDEGGEASQAITILMIVSFSIFIVVSLILGLCSVFGKSAKLTYCWLVLMWTMMFVAFGLGVGILHVVLEVSEDSCLYVDELGIRELKDSVDVKAPRIEALVRYYSQPVGTGNLNDTQIEELWDLPLSTVDEFLEKISDELFTEDGELNDFAKQTSNETQRALRETRALFPNVQESIKEVRGVMNGPVLNQIHTDLKDLLCCTYYASVDDVFFAWIGASVAGFILAALVTWQVLISIKFHQYDKQDQSMIEMGPPAVGQSAYMQQKHDAPAHYPQYQVTPQVVPPVKDQSADKQQPKHATVSYPQIAQI